LDLYVQPESIKLLEKSIGNMFHDIGPGGIFLIVTSKKVDCIKLKSFYTEKEIINKETNP
jgi:hypothetical protein